MGKGNINGALKLLTDNLTYGILPLDENILNSLKQTILSHKQLLRKPFLNGEPRPIIFDDIDKIFVRKVAIKNKGGSSPS